MTDQELEQRLREWYRAEVPAELAAPADLRSKVVAITRSSQPWRRSDHRRGITLLAAAALVGLLVGTAVVGGVLNNGSRPGRRAVAASVALGGGRDSGPSPTPQPATPSPTAEPCLTDTMTVLTGDAIHAATGADVGEVTADLGAGRGVYLGITGDPVEGSSGPSVRARVLLARSPRSLISRSSSTSWTCRPMGPPPCCERGRCRSTALRPSASICMPSGQTVLARPA